MKEYFVCFQKNEEDGKNADEIKIMRARDVWFLKNKIFTHMKQYGYINAFFTKRDNIGDVDTLTYLGSSEEEYEKYLELKDIYDSKF